MNLHEPAKQKIEVMICLTSENLNSLNFSKKCCCTFLYLVSMKNCTTTKTPVESPMQILLLTKFDNLVQHCKFSCLTKEKISMITIFHLKHSCSVFFPFFNLLRTRICATFRFSLLPSVRNYMSKDPTPAIHDLFASSL